MRTTLCVLAMAAALAAAPVQTVSSRQIAPHALTVRSVEEPLTPGGVGMLVVHGERTLSAVEGTVFERPIHFWPVGGGRWHGLVGVSLEATPGTYDVVVRGLGAQGDPALAHTSLVVTAKSFDMRRLRVAQRFVSPPEQEAARIRDDARRLAEVFAGTSARMWRGPFVAPVSGRATSSFGRLTVLNGQPNGRHQGADFRAATGTRITSPNAGRVVLAGNLYFAGNTVVIDHGLGLFSLFAHLSSTSVAVGDLVARGDAIGEAGATGRVTGPHLHWAVRLGSLSVDPLALIAATEDVPEPNDILSTR